MTWASKHLDIDWDLIDALIRYRAASNASHLLLHGHNPLALETEMALLDQRLRWLPRGH